MNEAIDHREGSKSKRRSDDVAQSLMDRIRSGELRPGDRLPNERELAVDLGVSRPVVREAISNLIGRGVVSPRGGSGSLVTSIHPDRAGEVLSTYMRGESLNYRLIHEVREVIETHVAAVAARRARSEDIEMLQSCVSRLGDESLDKEERAAADLAFHATLTELTGNEIYDIILSSLHHGMIEVRRHNLQIPAAQKEALRSHQSILDAITAGDELAAKAAMAAHLSAVMTFWEQ